MNYTRYVYVNDALTKAFILQNVLSKGFHIQQQSYIDYMDEQSRIGWHLLTVELPKVFGVHSHSFNGLLNEIASEDSFLCERLPGMTAFGYTQGRLVHELLGGEEDLKETVAQIGAIFNMGISLFDYVLDELSTGVKLYAVIDQEFLSDLMDLSKDLSLNDIRYKNNTAGTIERLLLMSIIAFGVTCRRLYWINMNKQAWDKLSASIFRLYHAEKITSDPRLNNTLSSDQWLDTLECKSVLPSITHSLISEVATASYSKPPKNKVEEICDTLGRIFWLADDLSDIAKDLKAGTPSYVTTKATKFHFSDKSNLSEPLTATIEDLFTLLNKLDKEMESLSIPDNTHEEVVKFAKMYVNAWLTE